MSSPTQRTLEALRADGYMAGVVERWNPHLKIRHDLFGFADVLAAKPGSILLVQATSDTTGGNSGLRMRKIEELQAKDGAPGRWLLAGGSLEVWAWSLRRSTATNADGSRSKARRYRLTRSALGWANGRLAWREILEAPGSPQRQARPLPGPVAQTGAA